MSRLKKVAIVGRPNVGKSALFNALCKKRISIVDEQEGITRDRLYSRTEFFGYPFEIIDTGGIEVHSKADFIKEIKQQAEMPLKKLTPLSWSWMLKSACRSLNVEVAKILHSKKKPICLAINKIDNDNDLIFSHQFFSARFYSNDSVSASHGFQLAELLESALFLISFYKKEERCRLKQFC